MSQEKPGFYKTLEMLRSLEPEHQTKLLESVAAQDPELATKLRDQLFTFEDLAHVNPTALRELTKNIPEKTLCLALRKCSDKFKEAVFKSMSERAANMLKENIDVMGPQPLSKVEEAQKEILETALSLESSGKITLRESSDDPLV